MTFIVHINQNKYLNSLLERFMKRTLTPVTTPVEAGIRLGKAADIANKEDLQLLSKILVIGYRVYYSTCTQK